MAGTPEPSAQRKRATSTSSFGVSRRENHDASGFYARFTAPLVSTDATVEPPGVVDQIYVGDARSMDRVRPSSVALVVTSPPYFAGKAYEEELGTGHIPATYVEYLTMLEDVFAECADKLEAGGRLAVNVANLGRKPYRSLSADVIGILQDRLGLLLRGEVIWRKARGAGGNCAWGSFKKPANPVLRDLTERVVIASKGRFDRAIDAGERASLGLPSIATTTADEFMDATLDVWELAPESANRVNHPAPFPVELPHRLIDLYTYRGDVVLDPFVGSGTTAVAAVRSGRHHLGYEIDEAYAKAARDRVALEVEAALTTPEAERPDKAAAAARELLVTAGFGVEEPKTTKRRRFAGGLRADWIATDTADREWLVLVAGATTITRSGLRRADVLFRTLGEASVLTTAGHRVLVLTTDLPDPRSAPLAALRDARGVAVVDVLELGSPGAAERLAGYAAGAAAPIGDLLPGT
ncbi:MAG: site-specific DNA-methyltransferase [Acidimicrobiales bacterium]